jgi:hypothetical protein
VTDIWNDLPQELVQAKTVKSFEILLDKYWENQEVKCDYNEEIKVKTGSHKKKFILDVDEEGADIVVERPASIEDPKVYRQIYNHEDSITLQEDLDNLAAWEKMWGMQFHPEKCNSLSVTRSQTPFHTSYILKCHTLESVTTAKYLGITISKDMNWDTHINNITAKANKIIGFLRRNLPIQKTESKTLVYKSMVRSNLEYCTSVWSPHTEKLKSKLEQVQCRAARYMTNRYHITSSVSAMLNHLQWPTLEYRRNLNRITMLYKITNNLIAVDPKLYLTPQPSLSTRNTNPLQYQNISTRTNYYKYSFFPHAVVLWNSLPYTVVNAGSLDQFKQLIQGQSI